MEVNCGRGRGNQERGIDIKRGAVGKGVGRQRRLGAGPRGGAGRGLQGPRGGEETVAEVGRPIASRLRSGSSNPGES